jgi:uncharacterized protein YndB with AHSA1/START domain
MYRATIGIAAAPEQVYAWLTDPQRISSWQPDVIEFQSPEGGLHVGARARALTQEYGRRFDVEFVVVALTLNEHVAWDLNAPTVSARIEYRLLHDGSCTRVECTMAPRFKGLTRWISPLLKDLIQRKIESRLALLRKRVEAGHGQ